MNEKYNSLVYRFYFGYRFLCDDHTVLPRIGVTLGVYGNIV